MTAETDKPAPLLVVTGPTGSGKSRLALRLALDLKAEMLCLDSVQVYKGFDIGSAKASVAEQKALPHHLLDICEPNQEFNVAKFLQTCTEKIKQVQHANKNCVVAGGSTLYLTCLLHGLAKLPKADPELRAKLERLTLQEIKTELERVDPVAANRIHSNDRLRLVRALETKLIGGAKQSELHADHAHAQKQYQALILVLCWRRSELYRRIEERTDLMLKAGLIQEVQALSAKYGSEIRPLQSLGYAQVLEGLRYNFSESQVAAEIKQATRNYAKRQMTFFRNEPLKRGWVCQPDSDSTEAIVLHDASSNQRLNRRLKDFSVLSLNYAQVLDRVRNRMANSFDSNELWYLDGAALDLA